jgi:stage V sporulation protein B
MGFVLVTILHFATVLKAVSFTFRILEYVKTLLVMALSGWIGFQIWDSLSTIALLHMRVIAAAVLISILYCLLVLLFGLVKKEELARIPVVGRPLSFLTFSWFKGWR